ncbi:MAG: hypothetical protein ABIR46_00490 [Candidatus Saccharimonadales bacterium]
MILFWALSGLLFVSFLLIVFRGAPFVPTLKNDVNRLFAVYKFKRNDVLVDLGSGDGRVVLAAAERGIRVIGYELNPFLAVWSHWRLKSAKLKNAEIKFGDFWASALPEDTAVVFVFLAGPFMQKLDKKMSQEAERLGHDITLISYGMKIPGKTPLKTDGSFVLYQYPGTDKT